MNAPALMTGNERKTIVSTATFQLPETPVLHKQIPESAFAVEADELQAFERATAKELRGSPLYQVDVVRTTFTRDGLDCTGYLLPRTTDDSAYLSGWFAGRRSVRAMVDR